MTAIDIAAITLAKGNHPAPPADCGNPERCYWECPPTAEETSDGPPDGGGQGSWMM